MCWCSLHPMHRLKYSALALALSASQATALSCLTPDAARTFQEVSASETTYVVLHGSFFFAERPERSIDDPPRVENFLTQFRGKLLTGRGFTDDVQVPITVNTTCSASWCGTFEPGVPYAAFVEQNTQRLTLFVDPCNTLVFKAPSNEVLDQITACATGGTCVPSED